MIRERWVAMGVALLLLAPLGACAANRAKLDPEVAASGPAVFDASRLADYSNDVLAAFLDIYRGGNVDGASDNARLISGELSRRRESAATSDSANRTASRSPAARDSRARTTVAAGANSEVTSSRLVSTADPDGAGVIPGNAASLAVPAGAQIIADRPSGDWYPDARREMEAAKGDPDSRNRNRRGVMYSTESAEVVQVSQYAAKHGVGETFEEELANTSSGGGGGSGEMRAGGLGEP